MGSNLSLSIKMLQSMMTALGLDESNFGSIYQDAMGRNKPCLSQNLKRNTLLSDFHCIFSLPLPAQPAHRPPKQCRLARL